MSNINELFTMKGELEIILLGPSQNVKQHIYIPNLIVTAGKNVMANYLAKGTTINNAMSHMGLGTGSTAPAAANTGLEAEITSGSVASTRKAFSTTSSSNNVASFQAIFAPGEGTNAALREAGLFNSSAINSGTMLCRTVFGAVAKEAADTLTINWNVTIN